MEDVEEGGGIVHRNDYQHFLPKAPMQEKVSAMQGIQFKDYLSLRKKPRAKSEPESLVLKTKLMQIKTKMATLGRRHFARTAWSKPWMGMEVLSLCSLEESGLVGFFFCSTD